MVQCVCVCVCVCNRLLHITFFSIFWSFVQPMKLRGLYTPSEFSAILTNLCRVESSTAALWTDLLPIKGESG